MNCASIPVFSRDTFISNRYLYPRKFSSKTQMQERTSTPADATPYIYQSAIAGAANMANYFDSGMDWIVLC